MIVAAYCNNYSSRLIDEYIRKSKKDKLPPLKINTQKDFFFQIREARSLFKILESNKVDQIIVCNSVNLICGLLIQYSLRYNIKLLIVEEGSKNYAVRSSSLLNYIKRIIRYFIAKVFGFPYHLHFGKDDLEINQGKFCLLTQSFLLAHTSTALKIVRPIKINYAPKQDILIIGQSIFDVYKLNYKKFSPLNSNILKFLDKKKVFYLPHPKSNSNGLLEREYLSQYIDFTIVNNIPAEEYLTKFNPSFILSMGGSSLFIYFLNSKYKNRFICFGFNDLIRCKTGQYADLYKFYTDNCYTCI